VLLVAEVDASGKKYRLGMPMSQIAQALAAANGRYDRFLELAARGKANSQSLFPQGRPFFRSSTAA
jgi:hypothetical protein